MPLIFAIDSDKRQSAQLASLLRAHVDADLVQSTTVLDGIDLLQGRIPDLVLTSSLLSPRDESALANHMRELGTRAAHVHTLTIPVLAAARKASKKRPSGVLGALRREKGGEVEAAGCQPEVFAKEVRIYLERAVEERVSTGDEAGVEPAYAEPAITEPVYAEPTDTEPAYTEPAFAEPVYAEPVYAEPVYAEPSYEEPAIPAPAYVEAAPIVETEVLAQAAEPAVVPEPGLPAPDAATPGDLYLDRPEIIERETLMAQPPAVVAQAFAPPETRVPVVDMNTFDDLDALAAQLAAPSGAVPPAKVAASDPFEQFFVPLTQGPAEPTPERRPLAVALEPEPFTETLDAGILAEGIDDVEAVDIEVAPVEIPAVTSDTWFDRMTAAVPREAPVKPVPPPAPEPVFSWIDNQTVSSLSDVLSRVRASDSDARQPVASAPPRAVPAISQAPAPVEPVVADVRAEEAEPAPVHAVAREPVVVQAAPEPPPMLPAVTARPEVLVDLVLPPAAPFLDPDVLAMFGAAAHRAGLDALESLSKATPTDGDKPAVPAMPIPGPERPRLARESKAERRSRRKAPRAVQDEWGMYDPTQCGPAALFDEDTWTEDVEERTPVRRPRAS